MSNYNELVEQSLDYFDTNYEKYSTFIDKIKYIKYDIEPQKEYRVLNMYDNDKKLLLSSRYELLGMYYPIDSFWTWAWAIPKMKKNITHISRKLLNYGTELDQEESIFLKSELVTSRFKVTNMLQIDIYCAIGSYLSKQPIVFKYKESYDEDIKKDIYYDINPEKEPIIYKQYFMFLLDFNKINL
jgi:hypothetical protein